MDWNANTGKALLVPLPRTLLVKIENLSEDEIVKLAKYIAKEKMADTVLLLKNEYNAETFLNVESWLHVSNMPYRHTINGDVHTM